MNKIIKIPLLVLGSIILIVAIMGVFSICPPQGPWPMPPWCDSCMIKTGSPTSLSFVVSIPHNTPESDIYLSVSGNSPEKMERIGYLTYEKTIPVIGQEEIDYSYTSDKGSSKLFSSKVTKRDWTIYDGVSSWSEMDFKPSFPDDFSFGMMMFDTWGRNYNFMMVENTRNNIDSSFEKLKRLNMKSVVVTDMFRAVYEDGEGEFYNSTNYAIEDAIFSDDFRDESLSQEDMNRLAKAAHDNGMKLIVETGISLIDYGNYLHSSNIRSDWDADLERQAHAKTKEWVEDFCDKKEKKILEVASMLDKAGADEIFINQRNEIPLSPYDSYADERLMELIDKIHETTSLKVNLFAKERDIFYADWASRSKLFNSADNIYLIIEKIDPRYNPYEGMGFETTKDKYSALLDDYQEWAEENNLTVNVYFGASSYKDSAIKGYIEFNDIRSDLVKNTKPDWQYQADVYEAFLQSAENRSFIKSITFMGYWWDDAMDPETAKTKISISFSNRNKNVESTIMKWGNSLKN